MAAVLGPAGPIWGDHLWHDRTGIHTDISLTTNSLMLRQLFTYIARTNSPSSMGLNYEVLASFGDLLNPITSDKKEIQDLKVFQVSI